MSLEALDALEAKIQQAADRIGELAEQNAELGRRVTELEAELAGAREAAAAATGGEPGGDSREWQEEKADLQRRVERLVARLEELLHG